MYPGLSVASFRVLYCVEYNGSKFLYADLRVSCEDDRYTLMKTVAIFCILVYVMGIPVLGAAMLFQQRHWIVAEEDMSDEMHAAIASDLELREHYHSVTLTYGALYLNYTHDAWYYEFIEMLRKALLTGMLSTVEKGMARTSTGTLLATLFMVLAVMIRPYRYFSNAFLQQILLSAVFFTFYTALLIDSSFLVRYNTELGDCNAAPDPISACRFDRFDKMLATTHGICFALSAVMCFAGLPPVKKRLKVIFAPCIRAQENIIAAADQDGDGDFSLGELLSISSEQRSNLLKSVEKEMSAAFEEEAHNLEHFVEDEAKKVEDFVEDEVGVMTHQNQQKRSKKHKNKKQKKRKKKSKKNSTNVENPPPPSAEIQPGAVPPPHTGIPEDPETYVDPESGRVGAWV